MPDVLFLSLTLGATTVELLVPRGTGGEQPDGPGGKRRWAFATAPVDEAVHQQVRAMAFSPNGAEGTRALDGTLRDDRAPVLVRGLSVGPDAAAGVACSVVLTEATYRHALTTPDTPGVERPLSLTLREK